MMVSTVAFLFLVGNEVHKKRLLGRYDFGRWLRAWLFVAGLVVGAIMSGLLGERCLEVELLAVVRSEWW